MQDNQHQTPEHPDDASAHPASGLVRVESDSIVPSGASLALPQSTPPSPGARLVQHVKNHSQLFVGACLGVVTTLFFSQTNSPSPSPTAVQSLGLDTELIAPPNPLLFTGLDDGSMPDLPASPPPVPADGPQFPPQLKFMDRFYFAAPIGQGEPGTGAEGWLMVDRFYFSLPEQTTAATVPPAGSLALPPATSPQQAVLPPASHWANVDPNFSGVLEVPPPPQLTPLSSGNQPLPDLTPSEAALNPLTTLNQRQHTLLGVVQTNHFGAALIKTQDSSYSVRVGEPIRQSNLTLAELDRDRVVLTNGRRRIVVNVGETF